jgi:histidinol-phosphatase (PHP family)
MNRYNFHTHSHFDDGREPLEAYVLSAIDKDLEALGFSAHAPLPLETVWALPAKDFPDYVAETRKLKVQYKDQIRLYLGLEIDYIPGISEDFQGWIKNTPLDYCIGSVHLVKPGPGDAIWFIDGPAEGYFKGVETVFGGDARKAVTAFYEQSIQMVMTQPLNIIGHLDKVKMHNQEKLFSTSEPWYQALVDKLLKAIKEKGVIVELNTRGIYSGKSKEYFPSPVILEKCLRLDIPVMVNTDAHHPGQILSHFEEGVKHLKDIGFQKMKTPFFLV